MDEQNVNGRSEPSNEEEEGQDRQQLEFFEGSRGHDSGAESGDGSPDPFVRGEDNDSTRGAFVTLSPPVSPGE